MLFVIVLAQIDLSVGSVVAVTGALSGVLVIKQGYPWWVGVIAALVMGILIGAFQGFWVAYVGIPGFIVTLAGMLLFRGLTYQVLDNVSLSPFPKGYYNIANGFLNGLLGGNGFDVFTLVIFGIGVAGFAYQRGAHPPRPVSPTIRPSKPCGSSLRRLLSSASSSCGSPTSSPSSAVCPSF